jgi:hypothetical protein
MQRPLLLALIIGCGQIFALSVVATVFNEGYPSLLYDVGQWQRGNFGNGLTPWLTLISIFAYFDAAFLHGLLSSRATPSAPAAGLVNEIGTTPRTPSLAMRGVFIGVVSGLVGTLASLPIHLIFVSQMPMMEGTETMVVIGGVIAGVIGAVVAMIIGAIAGGIGGAVGGLIKANTPANV